MDSSNNDEDQLIVDLHEAATLDQLSSASFALVERFLPQQLSILALRPIEFELPGMTSQPRFQPVLDSWIEEDHKVDIWLQRSPVNPSVTAVRHSDYTPLDVLHASEFYERTISRLGAEYGATIVAWRGSVWLATLTVFRTAEQGDFSDQDMQQLRRWQTHFSSAVRRVACWQETRLAGESLASFIWALPSAAVVLDWDLRVLHHNALCEALCHRWRTADEAGNKKRPRAFTVPGDILAAIEAIRPAIIEAKTNRPGGKKNLPTTSVENRRMPALSAEIQFLPSRTLSLSKGMFLVTLVQRDTQQRNEQVWNNLALLTRRERECVELAARGLGNESIGERLGTSKSTVRNQFSSIYSKLGLTTRREIIALFARMSPDSVTSPSDVS
ncbi:MAG: response regulator transcription factor [Candidatus Methylacidiphilales bacterium]|nr:helix-turn-helix transcriptional regulator [Candidatus Methylacidiphilales bacterium]